MNIEIANRLVNLRKKNGLSQEQLAEKLGLSRQAVSKWERAEASPDTDNLICLAKLYGVSLDDLLNTDEPVEEIAREQEEKRAEEEKKEEPKQEETKEEAQEAEKTGKEESGADSVHISADGVHVKDKDGTEVHISRKGIFVRDPKEGEEVHVGFDGVQVKGAEKTRFEIVKDVLWPIFLFGAIIAYILLGFFWTEHGAGWAVGWVTILYAIVLGSIVECIGKKRFSPFALPILIVAVYVGLGITSSLYPWGWTFWHPGWVLFLLIPVYYPLAAALDRIIHKDDAFRVHRNAIDADEEEDDETEEDDD